MIKYAYISNGTTSATEPALVYSNAPKLRVEL